MSRWQAHRSTLPRDDQPGPLFLKLGCGATTPVGRAALGPRQARPLASRRRGPERPAEERASSTGPSTNRRADTTDAPDTTSRRAGHAFAPRRTRLRAAPGPCQPAPHPGPGKPVLLPFGTWARERTRGPAGVGSAAIGCGRSSAWFRAKKLRDRGPREARPQPCLGARPRPQRRQPRAGARHSRSGRLAKRWGGERAPDARRTHTDRRSLRRESRGDGQRAPFSTSSKAVRVGLDRWRGGPWGRPASPIARGRSDHVQSPGVAPQSPRCNCTQSQRGGLAPSPAAAVPPHRRRGGRSPPRALPAVDSPLAPHARQRQRQPVERAHQHGAGVGRIDHFVVLEAARRLDRGVHLSQLRREPRVQL